MTPGAGVEALFARLLEDWALVVTLVNAADDDRRRSLIGEAGCTATFSFEEVLAYAAGLATPADGHDPGRLGVLAPLLGRLASAAAAGPGPGVGEQSPAVTFVIVGTQKGGTTALHGYLGHHPDICTAKVKETHFFHQDVFFEDGRPNYAWYHLSFSHRSGERVVGEATPNYMFCPPVAERLWRYNPALKVIAVLRDPVERAYSHYRMQVARGAERLSFAAALDAEDAIVGASSRDYGLDSPLWAHSYARRGFYTSQIGELLRWFGREQVLLLRSDDLERDHRASLADVYAFLGVAAGAFPPSHRLRVGSYPPIPAADRAGLIARYEGEIADIEALTGWDLRTWRALSAT